MRVTSRHFFLALEMIVKLLQLLVTEGPNLLVITTNSLYMLEAN